MSEETKDILNLSLAEMRSLMAQKELSSVDIVTFYLKRIAAYDQQGVKLNSIRTLNLHILSEAAGYDREEHLEGRIRGPLHGIPVLVKDNIDAVGMPTTAGSTALQDHYPQEDAPLVAALKKAGALILGKANMTQWANFMTNGMPNGYSALGGQVLCPYGPGIFNVGGSSSGSGAAVGAGLVPIAVGTETSGSILSPASSNSLVGLKPTLGLISRRGVIPIAASQDTAGPMGRSVADVALLMQVMAEEDPQDGATWGTSTLCENYLQHLDDKALTSVRLGVVKAPLERMNDEQKALFENVLQELTTLGVELVEVELPGMATSRDWRSEVLSYEFKPGINAYLKNVASHLPVHNIDELLTYNSLHAQIELRYGQSSIQRSALLAGGLTEGTYIEHRLQDLLNSRQQGIDYGLEHYQVAALLFPGPSAAAIGAKAGYPTLNMPAGYTGEGQPFSITFAGGAFSDPLLLGFAYAYEQAYPKRVWPKLPEPEIKEEEAKS
ncbi:MAG: amidase family protein [Symbiobacteriaceae bacterium]|nr:amidase family protein [Symbiobacteriaceae bacterium]